MMVKTVTGQNITPEFLEAYFETLVDLLFKILPMWEDGEETLPEYMDRLLRELIGCRALFPAIRNDAGFLSILAILQYLIETPGCKIGTVRRMVFQAISLCGSLRARYAQVRRCGHE